MNDHITVETHFEGKAPVVRQTYDRLLTELRGFGAVREAPRETSIHLDNRRGFAGVYTRKNYFNLRFRLAHKLEHPRITRVKRQSSRRYMHNVKLTNEADIDAELLGWLREAYDLSAG
jgi:hypothetical protein